MSARSSGSWPVRRRRRRRSAGLRGGVGPESSRTAHDVLGRAGAVDEALEQAVRGEPVGPVQARARHLARGPEAGQRGPAVEVDRHAADHVVGPGADGDRVAGDVEVEAAAELVDAREAACGRAPGRGGRGRGRRWDAASWPSGRRSPARRRRGGRARPVGVVVGHEPVAVAVAEVGPLAAEGLGQQVPRRAGDVEHRRVELHELHVAQLGPRAEGQGVAVAGGDRRVGRLAIELPRAPGRQHDGPGPDQASARGGGPRRGRRGSGPRG